MEKCATFCRIALSVVVLLLVIGALAVSIVLLVLSEKRLAEHSLMTLYASMQSRVPDEAIPMSDFPAAYLRSFLEKHPSKESVHDRVVGYVRMIPNPGSYKDASGGSMELYLFRPAGRSTGELAVTYDGAGNVISFGIAKLSYSVPDKFDEVRPE